MTSPTTMLADSTQIPADLTPEAAEVLALDTLAVALGDFGRENWTNYGVVLTRLAPSVAGPSEVLYRAASIWASNRPRRAMPSMEVVDALNPMLVQRGLMDSIDAPGVDADTALTERTYRLSETARDSLWGPNPAVQRSADDFTAPTDPVEAAALAGHIVSQFTRSSTDLGTQIVTKIAAAHPTETLAALVRLAAAFTDFLRAGRVVTPAADA